MEDADVFICYSRANAPLRDWVLELLRKLDVTFWYDRRIGVGQWREQIGRKGVAGGGEAGLDRLLVSLRDLAVSLAEKSEEMARLSEATSSQARDAGKTTEEALREVEALMRRLGAGESDVGGTS